MEECDDLSQLEELLNADINEIDENIHKNVAKEIDIFQVNTNLCNDTSNQENIQKSTVHTGDTDSSDDEEKRNYTARKYSDYGSQIKKVLEEQNNENRNKRLEFEIRLRNANTEAKIKSSLAQQDKIKSSELPSTSKAKGNISSDIFTDPIFGIRITKPLISNNALIECMQGREAVSMMKVRRYVEVEDLKSKDWVIAGVIVKKSISKKSQKGNSFMIWTLSDLKDGLKTVAIFLFSKAYNDLWKTSEGTVIAVLNPSVLDKSQNSTDQVCLSVDKSDKVMILGQSKDFGICKSFKRNGEPCTAFVNLNQCEHCIYHIKQEYQKYSKRQELQSPTMGRGVVDLQKKVFGKNTMIYGGRAFSASLSGNTKKIKENDKNRLMSLSDYYKLEGDKLMTNMAPCPVGQMKVNNGPIHSPLHKKTSDSDRLGSLSGVNSQNRPSLAERVTNSPTLGQAFSLKPSGTINLNMSYGEVAAKRARANAAMLIQKGGGIEKADPNNIKGTDTGKKRALEKLNSSVNNESNIKKRKIENEKSNMSMSVRFKKILEATSAHQDLIDQHENNEQEKYFNKLEKKESLEEKMLNTYKLACKAVRCTKCKYTAFSAAQLCKDERHPLKVLDTYKRFFKCADCKNRTISLELIPLHSCNNCKGSRWEKAPMLREKNVTLSEGLSIRGEEETFIGGQVTSGKNINLLVPDNES